MQLLFAQVPKAQKKTDSLTIFFAFLGSACVKASHKTLIKLTPGCCSLLLCFYTFKDCFYQKNKMIERIFFL